MLQFLSLYGKIRFFLNIDTSNYAHVDSFLPLGAMALVLHYRISLTQFSLLVK